MKRAVLWVAAVGLLHLLPALLHGAELGTADILRVFGLGTTPGAPQPYNPLAADQIRAFQPWAWLSWSQVHHGNFPLWNPYSGLGLPLLHNFQSAAGSLPMLVGYLAPQRYVYTVSVISTMLIAGTGVLWMCRRLSLGILPSTLAATAFMLSGAFSGWLGWPMAGTTCWLGWVTGCAIVLIRTPERVSYVAALAVVLAFMVYAGHPETLVIAVLSVTTVAAVMLTALGVRTGFRSCLRPLIALAAGGIAALGLSSPLLLPGLEVLRGAVRGTEVGFPLPAHASANLLLAGYHGYPVRGSHYFGPSNYYETAAYVGIIVLVLACLALVHYWRDPTTVGLGVVALLCGALAYSVDVSRVLQRLPLLQTVQWTRALLVLDFSLAVLAGIGLQAFLDRQRQRATLVAWWGSTLVLSLVIAGVWFSGAHSRIKAIGFRWPVAQLGLLVLIGLVLSFAQGVRDRTRVAVVLLVVETAFLMTATPSLWSSAERSFPVTSAQAAVQEIVGQERVGFARCPSITNVPNLGVLSGANAAYRLSQATAFDPILPISYFREYYAEIGEPAPVDVGRGQFCPSLPTAGLARHLGVAFVLTETGSAPPSGAEFRATIGGEDLYEIPGGGLITVQSDNLPPDSPQAAVVAASIGDAASLRAVVTVESPSTMYVHVTNYSGWRATIDGRNLPLRPWGRTMFKASLPAGRHEIALRYFPRTFTIGLALAAFTAFILLLAVLHPLRSRLRLNSAFAGTLPRL